jgi:hypothetical protein
VPFRRLMHANAFERLAKGKETCEKKNWLRVGGLANIKEPSGKLLKHWSPMTGNEEEQ